jgi:hypothetical protein
MEFVCFVWMSEQQQILLTGIKKTVFITEVENVYCEVRPEALYSTQKYRLGKVKENLECDMYK